MPEVDLHKIEESAAFIARQGLQHCTRLIILGTGFSHFIAHLNEVKRVSYHDIPHFPPATMDEPGYLVIGKWKQQSVVALKGRYHYYEGYRAQEIVLPLRALSLLGLKELIITNSAFSLRPELAECSLALIKDHINLIPANPLRGYNLDNLGPRFPDLDDLYSARLRRAVQDLRSKKGQKQLPELVYLAHAGPSLPSPAERNFYRQAGADILGMSTSLESIAAVHMGIAVLGVSVVEAGRDTDRAAGDDHLSALLFNYLEQVS